MTYKRERIRTGEVSAKMDQEVFGHSFQSHIEVSVQDFEKDPA